MQEKEGFDSTAALCALQRANNHPGKTREYLDSRIIRDLFKGSSLERDLALLRETLSESELAAVLEGRSFGRRKKLGLEDLDYSSVSCCVGAASCTIPTHTSMCLHTKRRRMLERCRY